MERKGEGTRTAGAYDIGYTPVWSINYPSEAHKARRVAPAEWSAALSKVQPRSAAVGPRRALNDGPPDIRHDIHTDRKDICRILILGMC